jgi:hypothetical protein
MLENQNFFPHPIIGVGSELFLSRNNVMGVDWSIVDSFRTTLLFGVFKFLFIDIDGQQDVFTTLRELGVPLLPTSVFVRIGNRPSEDDGVKCINALEFLYCPRLDTALKISNEIAIRDDKEKFVACLDFFCRYPIPYTKAEFRQMMING